MYNPVSAIVSFVGAALARAGFVEPNRAERTAELAWPRIVTGLCRVSQSAADLAMVGATLGSTAIAGIGIATPFWYLAATVGGGFAGGTISQVSQRFGAGADSIDVVVKQSAVVAAVVSLPFAAAYLLFPATLVGLLSSDPAVVEYGATYLRVLGFAVVFASLNLVASRALVGADDAFRPMVFRAGGALTNLALNAALVFGLGMGVYGVALGTAVSQALVTACFAYGFLGGRVPFAGEFPITVDLSPPYWDGTLLRQLFEISTPLIARGVAQTAAGFPLLALVGTFGPTVLAAFVVSRRVRGLLNAPGWGFGLAASSLVGQELGRGREREAEAYGWDILRFSLAMYLLLAAAAFVLARPIARVFVADPAVLPTATVFVRVAAVSAVALSLDGSASGPLTSSGDTRWPLYGKLVGLYVCTLPIVYLGVVTPLGIHALYAALVVETAIPAAVTLYRFDSGAWKAVSRSYRPEPQPQAAD